MNGFLILNKGLGRWEFQKKGNNTCNGPRVSGGATGQMHSIWKYFTRVRLLLFTVRKCQCENGNDNSLLILTVVVDAQK